MMTARAIETLWQLICYKTHFTHIHLLVLLQEFDSSFNARIWNILTFLIYSAAIPSTFDINIPRYLLCREKNEYRKKKNWAGVGGRGHFLTHKQFPDKLTKIYFCHLLQNWCSYYRTELATLWSCLISSPPHLSLSFYITDPAAAHRWQHLPTLIKVWVVFRQQH